jgi:hypothetical protein
MTMTITSGSYIPSMVDEGPQSIPSLKSLFWFIVFPMVGAIINTINISIAKKIHKCNTTTNIGTAKFFNEKNSKPWEQGTK